MGKILLIGAGEDRSKRVLCHHGGREWCGDLATLDYNSSINPDIVADLEILPYSWANDNEYDEIHAYEVLEHTGNQGDWKFFFDQFTEFHRILKPNGVLAATVPMWNSLWAFGDPSHKRVINRGTLVFLDQSRYGQPPMSDFRFYYKANFAIDWAHEEGETFSFLLRAIK